MMNACRSLPEAAMHSITIENFRCFREKQTARLAPLTLLVGENSTGKTSFLALLRVLDDFVHNDVPDFKRPPYDLGSFDEIAHCQSGRGGEKTFSAEIAALPALPRSQDEWKLAVRFGKNTDGIASVPVYLRISLGRKGKEEDVWMTVNGESPSIKVGTRGGAWDVPNDEKLQHSLMPPIQHNIIQLLGLDLDNLTAVRNSSDFIDMCKPEKGSPDVTMNDLKKFKCLKGEILIRCAIGEFPRVFASAPVRSQPRRTYDPMGYSLDPEGHYVPMFLARLSLQKPKEWASLKQSLENFGRSSGLFDEITIRNFGKIYRNPFQVQVRKSGKKQVKGPWRNLMDVGYGVSQALPIITELLREDADYQESRNSRPRQFLLQQPEVHLHPSAQAALGSLFCQVAGPRRQLIVETHSDHLMDRVRMDVRDGVSGLKPEDVSILFFERRGLDVRIHSLRLDDQGNVLGAPDGYRQFFMDEMTRSLWPERSSEGSKVEA
ncbi:MAG: AAA family ATPase [Synechococcus sp. SB0672_bin_10]|nr:AAA family ATPase [Synechococcus sp. SB0672_bin_10]